MSSFGHFLTTWYGDLSLLSAAFVAAGGVIFGGLHCLAWNFEFPTYGEKVAWRVCSLVTAAIPLAAYPYSFVLSLATLYSLDRSRQQLGIVILVTFGSVYVLARLYLVVESVRTLIFLPPEAYRATWASNLPHF